jgi:hypothetical protein
METAIYAASLGEPVRLKLIEELRAQDPWREAVSPTIGTAA